MAYIVKLIILIMIILLSVRTFALPPSFLDIDYPELWTWVSPGFPVAPISFRLPDNRGICIYHDEDNNEIFPGYIEAHCVSSQQHCVCHYYGANREIGQASTYWILNDAPGLLIYRQRPGGHFENTIRFKRKEKYVDLCIYEHPQNRVYSPGYAYAGSTTCNVKGESHQDYYQLSYASPLRRSFSLVDLAVIGSVVTLLGVVVYIGCNVQVKAVYDRLDRGLSYKSKAL